MPEIIHYPEHAIGPNPGPMGWDYHEPWAKDQLARMGNPFLRDTMYYAAAADAAAAEHRDILPWALEERVLGKRLRAHYQARGTCVSQGWSRGVQFANLVDMAIKGEGEEWLARVHPGSIYAGSRVEIGHGQISGDGSMGVWAGQAVTKIGPLYRIKYPNYDLTADQDELYSVQWGARGRGIPDELEKYCAQHRIADASLVTTGDEFVVCQYDWKPVPVCSGQGFTTTRDKYGMCYPRGRWSHCMLFFGLLKIKHDKFPQGLLVAVCWQSWGNDNPTGNNVVTLQTGEQVTLSPGTFLVDIDVLDSRMLPGEDSLAISGSNGWVAPISTDDKSKLHIPGSSSVVA